ncbi:hypothetical protein TSUD_286870 [Trifolium subterraneum]|uniref:Uncharacterized protein n=1 Tax=Trifolium subterraneum TaxID=3900 RepID=A0A2Z6MWU0_TRISU|nr:hypothetical protein TSUD_286870 [Trifolium subterraneum]
MEIEEKLSKFITSHENLVPTRLNDEGTNSSLILQSIFQTKIIGEPTFSISNTEEKVATTRFTLDLLLACTVIVAAPFSQHLFIFDPCLDERRVCSLTVISSNDVHVFDPDGENCANSAFPALISINDHGSHSPLQVPWYRGKKSCSADA